MKSNKHKGSSFESFLNEEDLLEEAEIIAIKRVIAHELKKSMSKQHMSKQDLADRMHTSRSALDRLLDEENTSTTLNTLVKAAHAIGKRIHISLS